MTDPFSLYSTLSTWSSGNRKLDPSHPFTMNPKQKHRAVGVIALSCLYSTLSPLAWASEEGEQCAMYLAPSSTGTATEPLWGLYAGRDYDVGERIGNSELAINFFNLRGNAGYVEGGEDEDQEFINELVRFIEGFMWVPEPAGAKFELVDGTTVSFIPGTGIFSAMNAKMTNAGWNHFWPYHRPMVGELPGIAHPGRGAQTLFYDVGIEATEKIKKGTEIFLDYGVNYEEPDDSSELSKADYENLDATISQMVAFFSKYEHELDDKSKRQIYAFLVRDVMKAAVGPEKQETVSRILPSDPDILQGILDSGGSITYDQGNAFRNMTWLEREGFCADNIVLGTSTIKEAGRGAFAKRTLMAGSTIAATPLIPIPDASTAFALHPLTHDDQGNFFRESDDLVGYQLAMNYCFGHPDSTMVFLPAGPGVAFINHSPKPNARLAWSDHPSSRKDWFNVQPQELMADKAYMGLVMEVVALDTIQEGEEIFIDYGPEWMEAWENHAAQWEEAHKDVVWPTRAVDLNEKYRTLPLPSEKQEDSAYPDNLGLMAFVMISESTAAGSLDDPKTWDVPDDGTVYDAANIFEVTVVDRVELEDHSFNYTIRWLNVKEEATYVEKIPHDAFVFVDRPESSDLFVSGPFRHPIQIPDDVFPKGPWRNV